MWLGGGLEAVGLLTGPDSPDARTTSLGRGQPVMRVFSPCAWTVPFGDFRVAWAVFPGTIVTVVPTADGGAQVETRVLPDWRKEGASVLTRKLSEARYESLRDLAKTGFWAQPAVAPTGSSGAVDGVVGYIEGLREGNKYAIVRHEPDDPHVRAVCTEFMRIIGEADLAPH